MHYDKKVNDILQHLSRWPVLNCVDQDILNLLAREDLSNLEVMPCEFNLRSDSQCNSSNNTMPQFLHGNRGLFEKSWLNAELKLLAGAERVLRNSGNATLLATGPAHLWQWANLTTYDYQGGYKECHPWACRKPICGKNWT